MVYSTPPPQEGEATEPRRAAERQTRAVVSFDGRRYVLDGPVATIGRSKECDCVMRDPNVSRKHAELRRRGGGGWEIEDLGSTNGVEINGRRVSRGRLTAGDEVTLGNKTFVFDIEQ